MFTFSMNDWNELNILHGELFASVSHTIESHKEMESIERANA